MLSKLDPKRTSLLCTLCKKKGICIQCVHGKCTKAIHPACFASMSTSTTYAEGFYCDNHKKTNNNNNKINSLTKKQNNAEVEKEKEKEKIKNWSESEKLLLYQAHASVNPSNIKFWNEVAKLMPNRSAEECQNQWFSVN